MHSAAIVFEQPRKLALRRLALTTAEPSDIVVESAFSGVSSGTEKMLFEGTMPAFPGMRYPLVPGYETVGTVVEAGATSGHAIGEQVFVPGANCYADAAGLFGATASRIVLPGARAVKIRFKETEEATLLALAATAHHAVCRVSRPASLVVGHGVLGRLVARMLIATGNPAPSVWERQESRRDGAEGYAVTAPDIDRSLRHDVIIDASGDVSVVDLAIQRLYRRGDLVLAGFYGERIDFAFPAAFMKEASVAIAAEFTAEDVQAVLALVETGRLSLAGLITHHSAPSDAASAYRTAFHDPDCLKMIIDWRKAA
ncbi:chlorophyll synthesis pathway protein BchC [Peteryoungia ipomoeae]|uniref:Chlorophyll synthesis pathway protein BchC n=1 Tax=Peteryoungia ipomoeae TaxID=1210932 RepID=A0A4S8P7R0_9HYPH|nr:chlorophyll synthesis pathway protein BchC [Peteryoungia ipomoeae]THV23779.1 chlorophyll synthesis pathway protein BchC [Peteryoungia ipomoeae]